MNLIHQEHQGFFFCNNSDLSPSPDVFKKDTDVLRGQQQKETKSENGYSFINPLAGLSIAAFVGFICWAYKNKISSQDMQEAFAAFFSQLYNVAK